MEAPRQRDPARIECAVAARALLRVPVEQVAPLRKQPGPAPSPFPVSFLKHSDEQTVVALAAVFTAIRDHQLPGDFRHWGAVAGPRFLGRATTAAAVPRFLAEGAWGVSPHVVPHRSLHAVSGTLSQALKLHGPNFGVGGGPGSEGELMLADMALLQGMRLPGVWLLFSRCQPDLCPDGSGAPPPGTEIQALALALVPVAAGLPRLALVPAPGNHGVVDLGQLGGVFDSPAPVRRALSSF